jgi:very-short-patch-repair endonuclease
MRAISRFGDRQLGLVTTCQVLESSTRHQIDHLVATGRLVPLRRAVYRCAGAPESWYQHLLAACLAAGDQAVASFRAAAALWELPSFGGDILEITVPGRQNPRLADVVVHQTDVWGPSHTARHHRVPVTSVARTLCDLTAVVWPWRLARLVNDAERRGLVTPRQILRVFRSLETKGRRRSSVMRAVLADRLDGIRPGGSDGEMDVAKILLRARLPRPVQQHRVRIGGRAIRLDLAYPECKIAIEYDGWNPHRTRLAFDNDRARHNELEIRGWIVLRFTSRWTRREIVATVRAAIDCRTRPHPEQLTVVRNMPGKLSIAPSGATNLRRCSQRRAGRAGRRRGRCSSRRGTRRRAGARWYGRRPRGARTRGCHPDARAESP